MDGTRTSFIILAKSGRGEYNIFISLSDEEEEEEEEVSKGKLSTQLFNNPPPLT